MRALGLILVTASLALSAGGVSYQRQDPGQGVLTRSEPQPDAQEMCRAGDGDAAPTLRSARIEAPQLTRRVLSLGTRGFNYSRPGDPEPSEARPASDAAASPSR